MAYQFKVLFFIVRVDSQICQGLSQYGRCSSNTACGCLHMVGAPGVGICGFKLVACSDLVPCNTIDDSCSEPDDVCVHHPRCNSVPICYPSSMIDRQICPTMIGVNGTSTTAISTIAPTPKPDILDISVNAQWSQNGVTVAGWIRPGSGLNQLKQPHGIYVDDDFTLYVADHLNHRIVSCKKDAIECVVVAGGNGRGNALNQLYQPTDVIFDKESNNVIICDYSNNRVVRWHIHKSVGEIVVDQINCWGIAMDDERFIYVSDRDKSEVTKYKLGNSNGILVAGGNGPGDRLNQLSEPRYLFVDKEHSVYISENGNHRVVKWEKNAKEGILVAGGNGHGSDLNQLNYPFGVLVDQLGTVYVTDANYHRIRRWRKGATTGDVIIGGNGSGNDTNQFNFPIGLSIDRFGSLYVADYNNHRVQRFSIT